MKQLLLFLLIFISYKVFSQPEADAITGTWLKIPKQDFIIEIYKVKNEYQRKITWAKSNEKQKLVGAVILQKLVYNSTSKKWENGIITDPISGKTYSATAKIETGDLLEVNGYIGFSFFGIKKEFRRRDKLSL